MTNLVKKAVIGFALASSIGTAAAANIILTDIKDWSASPITVSNSSPYTWTHDITDSGYDPESGMSIESALLTIELLDFLNKGNETFSFLIGSEGSSQIFNDQNINNGSQGRAYDIDLVGALSDLDDDGLLDITVSAATGNFQLVRSTLEAVDPPITAAPAAVPEPAGLVLLSIGLFCCGLVRRFKR